MFNASLSDLINDKNYWEKTSRHQSFLSLVFEQVNVWNWISFTQSLVLACVTPHVIKRAISIHSSLDVTRILANVAFFENDSFNIYANSGLTEKASKFSL